MNKKFMVKTLSITNAILTAAIVAGAVAIFFTTNDGLIKYFSAGLAVGALVGGVVKSLIAIPKKYKDKDERALLVDIVAGLIGKSVLGVICFILFVLALAGVVKTDAFDPGQILFYSFGILLVTFAAQWVAYMVIDRKM